MSECRPSITAVIIARDEAEMIGPCLDSLGWSDELLVLVDSATTDLTREVVREHGARVEERPFVNFAEQRDAALGLAHGDWVLFVDADERVSRELREEITARVADPNGRVGFWIPRDNLLMGRLVRGGGWYPDYQLRLMQRGAAHFDPRRVVHEVALLDGPAGHLDHALLHLNYRSIAEFKFKQERYARLEAERWLATHGRPRLRALIGQPVREFLRRYVQLGAYREGRLGLQLSLLLAWYTGKAMWLARGISSPR